MIHTQTSLGTQLPTEKITGRIRATFSESILTQQCQR